MAPLSMVWVSATNPFAVITLHADRQQLFVERNEVASARSALNVVKTPWVRAGVDRGGHPNNDDTVTGRSALLGGQCPEGEDCGCCRFDRPGLPELLT